MTQRALPRNERGVVGGADGLAFGVLILLAGTLVVANAWSVLDHRTALDAAAREYLRAYTEAPSADEAARRGAAAVDAVLNGRDRLPRQLRVTAPDASRFGPCEPVSVALAATVPAMRVPILGELGAVEVTVRHDELVDAHRELLTGPDHDPASTPCELQT